MRTIVLYHTGWAPTRQLAQLVANELSAKAVPFDRRPPLADYDRVLVGTPMWGLVDPKLAVWATSGALTGKALGVFSDSVLQSPFWGFNALAVLFGGAWIFPEQLHVGHLNRLTDADRAGIRTWCDGFAAWQPPAWPGAAGAVL